MSSGDGWTVVCGRRYSQCDGPLKLSLIIEDRDASQPAVEHEQGLLANKKEPGQLLELPRSIAPSPRSEKMVPIRVEEPQLVRSSVGDHDAIVSKSHSTVHADTTYYFCCPGCRGRFVKNPLKFLEQETNERTGRV